MRDPQLPPQEELRAGDSVFKAAPLPSLSVAFFNWNRTENSDSIFAHFCFLTDHAVLYLLLDHQLIDPNNNKRDHQNQQLFLTQ